MEIREERKEREIRVFDLFISVLQRWRSLLICLLIGAVVLGAYGWYKSGTGTASAETETGGTDVTWEEVLGPDDMEDVEQLYATMQEYAVLTEQSDSSSDISSRLENMEHITAIQNNISSTRARFSDDQKAYLASLMGDDTIVPGDEDTYVYKDNVKNGEEKARGRHINKKYVVVGALLGLILAALIIIIKYVAKSTIKTASETEENLNLQILGRFDGSSRFYEKRKTALDRWLRRVKQKNKQKLAYAENIDLVAAKLQITANKQDLKQICMVVDSNVDLARMQKKEFLADIAEKTGSDPKVLILEDILANSRALHEMSGTDGAVIVLQSEETRFADVQYERMLCEGNGVTVLGAIVVE